MCFKSFLLVLGVVPFLARGVPQQLIQFFSGLHAIGKILLGAMVEQIFEEIIAGFHGDSQGGNGVDNAVVAVLFEGVDVDVGGFSELGHIGQ